MESNPGAGMVQVQLCLDAWRQNREKMPKTVEQKCYQSHHTNSLSPSLLNLFLFTWILLQLLWPFPQAFLVYSKHLSFALTFNLYCSKVSFWLIKVLLPLKYNSQRQSLSWGSQSFSFQTHQNHSYHFSSKIPPKFPFTLPSSLLPLPKTVYRSKPRSKSWHTFQSYFISIIIHNYVLA